MNAKCDLKVLLYTYKVVHVFALCCFCSVLAVQYHRPLCLWLFLPPWPLYGHFIFSPPSDDLDEQCLML